ncbi:hypothetical protein BY996DRAFT_6430261 [Phakopsora pachyrhizi]|nr:hypothetical protein BY996DRAFT_6430261 [Phakopsora pachyrhizi]
MFGNYIRSMPKLNDADERSKNKSAPPGSRSTNLKYSGGPTGSGKASQSTRCQKCEKFGHFTYNCPVKAVPYKSRPSRTQQLINPKVKRQEPSVEVPEEFLSKKGVAAKILEKNEQVRREKQLSSGNAKPSKRDGKKKLAKILF